MSQALHPPHTSAPLEVGGLLIPRGDLDADPVGWSYVLFNRGTGWRLVRALDDAVLPSVYQRGTGNELRVLAVELGADLTTAPEGAITTVTLVGVS
ncbi:hypothetical protein [Tenggerimyces flavus]|uniref:Uncharacterized protein n=1 Tax=Tenggerimyces flavus TaxID=1708749 RepID=A0ABV7YLR8_9ACTN|nr:hypothetical protein [Tenggerimyces flavus]MBM7787790.1 hypothetical protein [Tenggerimyces flavus]